jgi:RNA polymerase sigma-70 factor, ECF subfamily
MLIADTLGSASGAITDREALERVKSGDSAAFELIMRRYNRRLYRIARGILRNNDEAEDAVQEAYVRAFEKMAQFKGEGPLAAWLSKITINEALGRLRRTGAGRKAVSLDDLVQGEEANSMSALTFVGPDPEQSAARGEFRRLLETAIDALPGVYRLVFILRGVEEMSVAEAADCLEVEPATIKTRYHRARRLLQQHLSGMVNATAPDAFPFAGERCDRIVTGVFQRLEIHRLKT